MTPSVPENKILVQFDGICVLCSRTVKIILKADRKRKFVFQSIGQTVESLNPETVIVWQNDIDYQYFDAILKIGKELGGVFRVIDVFRILPKKWRKAIYLWVARNRFKWFGKRTSCYLPTEEEKERFV